MTTPKIKYVLDRLCAELSRHGIAHSVIGAMALAFYGIPRFTADVDILAEETDQEAIIKIMAGLGFKCFQNAAGFAQFDSEGGILGRVDFMFVKTTDGVAMLHRRAILKDDRYGSVPVVQPSDYVILKLMAIANNKERKVHDSADLNTIFKADAAGLISPEFSSLDDDRIQMFAQRFGLKDFLYSLRNWDESEDDESL